jgi:NAD(P)-dependent dehydrogenase (short-subunit alcohol dehydrogenase family)
MKTAVITGVSRGIGQSLAKKFLEEGYKVVGTSTSGKVKINNSSLEVIKLDLSDPTSILKASNEIVKKTSDIDVLINNAGVNLQDFDVIDMDISTLRKTLEINLIGLIDFTERLLPNMSSKGQIINTSSVMGSLSKDSGNEVLDDPCYRISKTAVNMYTKTLASRLRKQGITVSSVHPGWVKTDMGGGDAPRKPEEAAVQIFMLATTPHQTGLFWYDNKKFPW